MKILIATLSCHARPYQRLAIRETWINDLPVEHRFFLGRPIDSVTISGPPKLTRKPTDDHGPS
jgi:hypothetical protein